MKVKVINTLWALSNKPQICTRLTGGNKKKGELGEGEEKDNHDLQPNLNNNEQSNHVEQPNRSNGCLDSGLGAAARALIICLHGGLIQRFVPLVGQVDNKESPFTSLPDAGYLLLAFKASQLLRIMLIVPSIRLY
jgi:hypothetical protein